MPKGLIAALTVTSSMIAFIGNSAVAQNAPGNLERLGQFKTTGASPEIPTIPQTGPKADAIKKNLQKIKLPAGFQISLYALVPDARHMAVGPQGIVTFVGSRKNKIYAVTDRAKSGVAEEVIVYYRPRDPERTMLLKGRVLVCGRAESSAYVSSSRVLL
jgi:hypothetical protein